MFFAVHFRVQEVLQVWIHECV
jgi:hypothetical protein